MSISSVQRFSRGQGSIDGVISVGSFRAVCLLLAINGAPAYAEWVPIDATYQSPGLRTVYIDRATIKRDGKLVTISALIDWRSMQGGRSPARFYSTTFTKQFDCGEMLVRGLAAVDFFGHMGSGEPVGGNGYLGETLWTKVEPEGLNDALSKAACRKQ